MIGLFIFAIYWGGALKTFEIHITRGSGWLGAVILAIAWPAEIGDWLARQVWK